MLYTEQGGEVFWVCDDFSLGDGLKTLGAGGTFAASDTPPDIHLLPPGAAPPSLFREPAFPSARPPLRPAARATPCPAYLNYTLGQRSFRRLRAAGPAPRGGRSAWRMFHDEFLSHGGPPIPMLRRLMLGNADGTLF